MTREPIWLALVAWAAAASPLKVMRADQNAPVPKDDANPPKTLPYVTLKLGTNTRVGEDHVGLPDNDGNAHIVGNRELIVSLQAIGNGALDGLEAIRSSLGKPSVQDTFCAAGLAYVESMPILDITNLVEVNFIERGSLDIRFRTDSVITDNVGIVAHVEIEGNVSRYPGDPSPITQDFET